MEQLDSSLAPLLARRELWLLVSVGFIDPYHGDRFALLGDRGFRTRVRSAAELLRGEYSEVALGPGELAAGVLSPDAVFAALDSEAAPQAYRDTFGLIVSSPCPPCAIEYEPNTDVTYRSHQMADIAGFYSAFGLEAPSERAERLDHISVEAEFLYLLSAKEAAALAVEKREEAQVCREARKNFFTEHVGWWLPAFATLLVRTSQSEFYSRLAHLTASLSAIERTSLGVPPFSGRVVSGPVQEEPGADCLGCPAAGM